jgi:hypothetical protein
MRERVDFMNRINKRTFIIHIKKQQQQPKNTSANKVEKHGEDKIIIDDNN